MEIVGDINPYLRAIGRLIVNFNALENSLRRLSWLLIDPKDQGIGQIVTGGIEISRLEDLIKTLFPYRVQDEELRTRLRDALAEVIIVRRRRNDFAHGIWRIPNEATDLSEVGVAHLPTRKKQEYTEVDDSNVPAAIEKAATEAYRLGVLIDELLEKTKELLGSK